MVPGRAVRVGDAEAEIWLEGADGRSYLVFVQSKRGGRRTSKRWLFPVYRWRVEQWEGDEDDSDVRRSMGGKAKTFEAAMEIGRQSALAMETIAASKFKRTAVKPTITATARRARLLS